MFLLALISVPVVIWNAADGAGKSLSLVWLVGGMAGYLVVYMGVEGAAARSKLLAGLIVFTGAAALSARIFKHGFDPYDLQTAFLMIVIFFGNFWRLNQAQTVWKIPGAIAKFGASYSYSLYLVHNTVLVIVFENTHGLPKPLAIGIRRGAHLVALLVYHLFEKHHRAVGTYLRPIFTRKLLGSAAAPAPQSQPAPAAAPVAASVAAAPVMADRSSEARKQEGRTLGAPDIASAQPKRVGDHRYGRQAHRQRGDQRAQQPAGQRIEHAGGDRDAQRVVAEREAGSAGCCAPSRGSVRAPARCRPDRLSPA